MSKLNCKILATGIILLFIGLPFSSAISVDTTPCISKDESEECIECEEVKKAELVKVKQLLSRVEEYCKLLLVLSKYTPEIKDEMYDLSYRISKLTDEILDISSDEPFPLICDILELILDLLDSIKLSILNWIDSADEGSLNQFIAEIVLIIYLGAFGIPIGIIIGLVGTGFLCDWAWPNH